MISITWLLRSYHDKLILLISPGVGKLKHPPKITQEPGNDGPGTEPKSFTLRYLNTPILPLYPAAFLNFHELTNSTQCLKSPQLADTVSSCYTDFSFFNWLW